jgi:hypothetical protein
MVSRNGLALLEEALKLSRDGDVDGAAAMLRAARAAGDANEACLSLLFQLVSKRSVPDEAIEIAGAGLALAKTPVARSNWALRRGLAHLERSERAAALVDLQLVLKLKANDGHVEQARAALLRVAALKK